MLTTNVGGVVTHVPFASNTIPTSRLAPQTLAIQAYEPLSNTTTGTYSAVPSQAVDFDQYTVRQVKLDHRASYGLSGLISYTYSKFMQFNQSPALGGNTEYEYALSPCDTPHNVAGSGSYELSFGSGRHYLNRANALTNGVLGGCQIQTILTYGQVRAKTLRSDKVRQYDASIFKNFAMPRESVLSFRAEFFNLSNTTSLSAPSSTIDTSSAGR